MATTLTLSNVQLSLGWTYTNVLSPSSTSNIGSISFRDSLSNGTATDNADLLYVGQHSISASGTLNLDLAGSLTNYFGTSLTFAKIKLVYVGFDTTNTSTSGIVIGNGATPFVGWFGAAAHTEQVMPTGFAMHYRADSTGWPVTATTADILKIANSDSSAAAVINVVIVGTSV